MPYTKIMEIQLETNNLELNRVSDGHTNISLHICNLDLSCNAKQEIREMGKTLPSPILSSN